MTVSIVQAKAWVWKNHFLEEGVVLGGIFVYRCDCLARGFDGRRHQHVELRVGKTTVRPSFAATKHTLVSSNS